ncbi:Flp pilus assembly protein CpaB [Shewanella psychrotolerans]|uniref:Flp pilus assembly protein CpaB n=1 Tax=Shewanella psychrotolerans TaxID=2864206 RepID=UPI001C65861E|nr:Flp pilus assembly protein CpaB [Shewanella psychrotolerans]QYK01994.1 Flp pilus assembly protein CpaB [Shewanella psychrotolerans]
MKLKSIDFNWILLVIALILGGISAWATKNYFITKEQQLRDELSHDNIEMADVIVATKELRKGDIISDQNMSVRQIRADTLPLDAIHPSRFGEVAGQMILEPMLPGRPLIGTYLPGMRVAQFSDILQEGQRAITIDIDEINSSAGMLVPSDHIDVLLAFKEDKDGKDREKLQLLIEDATVLATGRRSIDINPELVDTLYDNPNAYNTVTLALSVEDAARVALAKEKGDFVTLLRNQKETSALEFVSLHEGQIFDTSEERLENSVEVITGGSGIKTSTQTYPLSNEMLEQLSQQKDKAVL